MKQIKLKNKFRQANSSLRSSKVGRVIRMLLGQTDVLLASNILLIVLVCLMAIGVCCVGSSESNQLKLIGANRATSDGRNSNSNDKQSLLILLSAIREFCSNNPIKCQSDRLPNNCLMMGERLVCNPIDPMPPVTRPTSAINGGGGGGGGNDKGELQSNSEMSRENRTKFSSDELAEGQFWLPKIASVAGECNVGLQDDQPAEALKARERILDMLAKYETLEAATEAAAATHSWAHVDGKKVNDKFKRNKELYRNKAAGGRSTTRGNTYRVTLDQANRLIRAHRRQQQQQNGLLAPLTGPIMLATGPGGVPGSRFPGGDVGSDLLMAPKRTEFSSSSPSDEIRLESGIIRASNGESSAIIGIKTNGHQLAQLDELGLKLTAATSRLPNGAEEASNGEVDALKCNMRRFIYRATKTDRAGNQCTGLITASICYGACDTGEIADWLFPHKKSIHKVCRHGRRIRQETRLKDCTTSSGAPLALEEEELDNLMQYHYVDALDCVCKRCTSADTTCLGTMSTPHLQTLGEISEIGRSDHNQHHSHQQQQLMASSGGD